ncbi:MAG: hypothetical protein LBJ08_06100 [Bifidobacteriaceae bacterium]|jgi:hypothetical protein|nr:hypothetical protein [Bifidobacteriaceae bacterium]
MATIAQIAQAADEAKHMWDNPFKRETRGYWAVQDTVFDKFMATHDQCVEELCQLVRSTGGPELDGSVQSLEPLNDWLEIPILLGAKWDDGYDWWPTWASVQDPNFRAPGEMSILQYFRLQGRIAFYYADVLISQLPGSQWVCWREGRYTTERTGSFLLDIGTAWTPADPLGSAFGCIYASWKASLDPTDPRHAPLGESTLMKEFESDSLRRMDWLSEGRELTFQPAPTGRAAGIVRRPFRGSRVKRRLAQAGK